jgi:hypothetical protein
MPDILEREIEFKLNEVGIKEIQFNHRFVHFFCEGKRFRCVYRSDYAASGPCVRSVRRRLSARTPGCLTS